MSKETPCASDEPLVGHCVSEQDRETFRRVCAEVEADPEKYRDYCWMPVD